MSIPRTLKEIVSSTPELIDENTIEITEIAKYEVLKSELLQTKEIIENHIIDRQNVVNEMNQLLAVFDSTNPTEPEGDFTMETVSRTVNLDNSMSTAEMQTIIDSVGKYIPAEVIITFQFADGTYTLAERLDFIGFFGGGIVYIQGNRTETDANELHTSQQVYLDGSGFNNGVVGVYNTNMMIRFYNLKIAIAGTGVTDRGIDAWMNFGTVDFWYGYIACAASSDIGEMLYFATCLSANVFKTYTYRGRYSIYARANTNLYSDRNDETGTMPLYGLYAQGACIRKSGSQPSGSTANELVTDGGEIV